MIGRIQLKSSYKPLEEGFRRAKEQALVYVHEGDPVGKWYDASLPGRDAFCMRDVAHQSTGAHFLGLEDWNRNMLNRFALSVSGSRDYCGYWEINKQNLPAPVDYRNDEDFWYNLPANFDLVDCCLRQFNWTGDRRYVDDGAFIRFYDLTFGKYLKRWDRDGLGIPVKRDGLPYRGIASYLESRLEKSGILVGSDLVAALFAGYRSYSELLRLRGDVPGSEKMNKKSKRLKEDFRNNWWFADKGFYYTAILQNGDKIGPDMEVSPLPLYFGLIDDGPRADVTLDILQKFKGHNVETLSHFPDVLYRYGKTDDAFASLMSLMDPDLKRKEYPEVSFSIIGSAITGLAGLSADGDSGAINVKPDLPVHVDWVEITEIPLLGGVVDIELKRDSALVKNRGLKKILCGSEAVEPGEELILQVKRI